MKSLIIIITSLFLLFTGVKAQKVIDKVIAVVGDKPVLYSEVEAQKLQAQQQGIELKKEDESIILEDLMFQNLLLHQAEIDSIEIKSAQVNAELEQRIQYFAAQIGGIGELEKFYGKSIEEIKDEFYGQIEDRMKTQKMEQKITEGVSVSPKEVRTFFNKIPKDSVPEINSQVSVAQLVIKPEITYEGKKKLKEELSIIRGKIISGELTFNVAAEFYSEDPGSKKNGGDFGWVTRGTFVPEFDAVAFKIPLNEVSEIFETQYGYHITVIEDRRGEQFKGRHILLSFKPEDKQLYEAKKKLDSIKSEIESGNLSWDEAVVKYSTDDQTKGTRGVIYNEQTGSSYWDMQNLDPQIFAAIKNLEKGEISKPQLIQTREGAAYRIVKLVDRTKPHKANLKDDYQLIQTFALRDKKQKVIEQWVNQKVKDIYVRVDDEFKNGNYQYKWFTDIE